VIFDIKKKVSYVLVLSWFCLLTFNLFKNMIYGTNDWLKFVLQEEKRVLMTEEGDVDEQNKRGPLRVHTSYPNP